MLTYFTHSLYRTILDPTHAHFRSISLTTYLTLHTYVYLSLHLFRWIPLLLILESARTCAERAAVQSRLRVLHSPSSRI